MKTLLIIAAIALSTPSVAIAKRTSDLGTIGARNIKEAQYICWAKKGGNVVMWLHSNIYGCYYREK